MGACTFVTVSSGRDADSAFDKALNDATWEHGYAGYTGTIAEKDCFVMCGSASSLQEAHAKANQLLDGDDSRISDKWGPAGCISVTGSNEYVFFGWASE